MWLSLSEFIRQMGIIIHSMVLWNDETISGTQQVLNGPSLIPLLLLIKEESEAEVELAQRVA